MKIALKVVPFLVLNFFATHNTFSQWRYPNHTNIKNDIIITYDVKYDRDLSEKEKQSSRFKKEIVVVFNGSNLSEKTFSNNLSSETYFIFDYEKELSYSCMRSGKSKNAVVSKFKNPIRKVEKQVGKLAQIIGVPCEVYTTKIKGETREIYTTKKFGLKYVKYFMAEGFLLKYSSNDKYLGPYTVTAKNIIYTNKVLESNYSLEGVIVRSAEEQKEYTDRKASLSNQNKEKAIEKTGKPSPSFTVRSIRGKKFKTKELKGKVLVLNFWFTTCSPCKKEIPQLNKLKARFKEQEVEFIAIGLDLEYKIGEFIKMYPFVYDIVEDGRWLASKFDISLYPTNVIIDQKGVIQFYKSGYKSDLFKAMSYKIDKLIMFRD